MRPSRFDLLQNRVVWGGRGRVPCFIFYSVFVPPIWLEVAPAPLLTLFTVLILAIAVAIAIHT